MAIYKAEQVEQFANDVLKTNLAIEAFCENDDTLTKESGDTVSIWRYTATGAAEKVAYGEGNTGYSDIDGEEHKFTVAMAQDRVAIYDEDIQNNPYVANQKMAVAPAHIINIVREDVVDQWYETSNINPVTSNKGIPTVEELITSVSNIDLGVDNGLNGVEERICLFLNPKDFRAFQAYLTTANVIVASEIIEGKRFSTVAGIPFAASDLVLQGSPVLATNKAVRLVNANCKNTGVEREENIRRTSYYVRKNYVAGLEFASKVLIYGKALTITKTAPSNGTFEVATEGVANARVYIKNITPASGYVVDTISVTDADGDAVEVDQFNSFKMPAAAVTVAVTFKTA